MSIKTDSTIALLYTYNKLVQDRDKVLEAFEIVREEWDYDIDEGDVIGEIKSKYELKTEKRLSIIQKEIKKRTNFNKQYKNETK